MALWILNRPPEKCSLSELQVAEFLAALPDLWIVRWGFYYRDNHGASREGDFLVLGPAGGLLVLEAKAGTPEFNPYTGRWNTADGDNPQFQLDAEWSGVRRVIEEARSERPPLCVGRALALPGASLPPGASDLHGIERRRIFDSADLRNFEAAWDEHMRRWGAHLDPRGRALFFDTYGRDATPQAVRHFVDETDRQLIRQTEAEYELLDALAANRHFLVQGGTGSGKTWLAFELACRWADTGHDARVLFLCYNLALTELIREMVERAKARKRLRRGEIVVRSWEGLASELVTGVGLSYDLPPDGPERTRFYEQDLPQLLGQIVAERRCKPQFDALVVDEAQDHDTSIPGFAADWVGPGWWGVYLALLKEHANAQIAAFYDPAQRPSFRRGGGFDAAALLRIPGLRAVQVNLTRTVRYNRPVFSYLKGLQSRALAELNAGLLQRGSLPDGPEIVFLDAKPSEVASMVDRILSGWFEQGWCRPEQVLVLSRHGQMHRSALKDCRSLAGKPLVNHLERRAGEIGILSVNRAKGLDALAVVLVDYGPWETLPEADHAGCFMGPSRARQLLAIVRTTVDDATSRQQVCCTAIPPQPHFSPGRGVIDRCNPFLGWKCGLAEPENLTQVTAWVWQPVRR